MHHGALRPYPSTMRVSPGDEAKSYYDSAKETYALGHYKTALDLAKQAVYASTDWPEAYVLYYFCNLRVGDTADDKAARDYKDAAYLALDNLRRICANKGLSVEDEMAKFVAVFPETKAWAESLKKKTQYYTVATLTAGALLSFWVVSKLRSGA